MVYNRSQQQPGVTGNESYWMAWNADGTVGERVLWKKYEYQAPSGALIRDEGWISLNPISGTRKIWTGSGWSTSILASIYDYASQTYVPLN
jgi:hypothetical protein